MFENITLSFTNIMNRENAVITCEQQFPNKRKTIVMLWVVPTMFAKEIRSTAPPNG